MTTSKVCPLCGTKYGPDETLCPADGRLLVEEPGSDVNEATDPVRLSSATEALLGNILDEGDDTPPEQSPGKGKVRLRHGSTREDRTVVGPPPDMSEHLVTPGEEEVEETTVATAVEAPSSEDSVLPTPLASLGLSSDEDDLVDELDGPRTARHSRDAVLDKGAKEEEQRAKAGVFDNLQMEADQIGTEDVSDHEVTRRVVRDAPVDATRRSEMPPEFAEALRREQEAEAAARRAANEEDEEAFDIDTMDPVDESKTSPIDEESSDAADLEPVGFDLENAPETPKRAVPESGDLSVARMEMNIGSQDDNDARYFFVGLFVFAAAVAAFLAYVL